MHYKNIQSSEEFNALIASKCTGLFYFSHNSCNVGVSIKEKIEIMINEFYPVIKCYFIDVEQAVDLTGQQSIFVYPTILVFFEGKEFYRFSRNISLLDMKEKIARPYKMLLA